MKTMKTMKTIENIKSSIPKKVYNGMIPIITIIFLNMGIISSCSYFGCYDVSFSNIMRMNLVCNACTDISYHLQNHQIKLYMFIGGYLLKRVNEVIDQQVKNISPSKNWE
mgnify:FL=1|tara:strand:+ start:669 stop:998 length:330 start_codon:yes stop_codon:yes gene_type:complete